MQGPTLALDDVSIPLVSPAAVMAAPALGGPAQGAPHQGKTDFWNNHQQATNSGVANLDPPVGVFVHDVEVESGSSRLVRGAIWFVGVLFTLTLGYVVWNFVANDQTPSQSLSKLWNLVMGAEDVAPVVEKPKVKKKLVAADPVNDETVHVKPVVSGRILANPYEHLENQMSDTHRRRTGVLTGEQAVATREGLNHQYYFQRYKAVLSLVGNRYDGSEPLLRDALQTGKFWMRMQAVMGLADMGYTVTPEDIKTALSEGHNELRERYFARYERGACTLGCQYVARGTLMFLNAPGRLAALRVMSADKNIETGDYMVAATFDSDERVRAFATTWLLSHPVSEDDWWRVYETIAEDDSDNPNTDAVLSARQG